MNKFFLKSLILSTLALLLNFTEIWAQTNGRISGKITDKKTGEELIGVAIQVEGTSFGTVTDYEGKFNLSIAPGTYNLIFSYISYSKKIVKGIEVKSKDVTTINVTLEQSTQELNEVVIQAEARKETASALLIQQKKSVAISDGVSADLIKRTPDATTSDVMKRVSGTSIQDNKFAVIRGLNDRYNTAYINGAPLPSTESDRKAFSFDIFPSNMIDNMVITKTASPELPGDFAGGVITINTKDIPEKKFISFGISSSVHSITTFKEGYRANRGANDWIGLDDGTRALPSGIPARLAFEQSSPAEKYNSSFKFNDQWQAENIPAIPVNTSINFSAGSNFKIKEKQEVGFILSLSRSESFRNIPVERNKFNKPMNVEENQFRSQNFDSIYKREVLVGSMFNVGWKAGKNHKISFKNAYTINTEDQTIFRSGLDDLLDAEGLPQIRNRYYIYQQNTLLSNQLIGEHYIVPLKLKAKWVLNNNQISRQMPDFRRASYRSTFDGFTGEYSPYTLQIGPNIDITQTGRFYSDLKESIQSAGVDFQLPLEFLTTKHIKTDLKVGGFIQKRERDFQVRVFGYKLRQIVKPGNQYNYQDFITQNIDQVFSKSNFAEDTFYMDERINPQDVYKANSTLKAGYIMLDQRFFSRFRAAYGVRIESYNQQMNSLGSAGEPVNVDTTFIDLLPSANLTYELTEKINLRLSGSRTLARPEFRELAPFAFYDFNINSMVVGNPNLNRTRIQNYDFRFEYYMGESQLISASLFYKKFENAIEQVYEFTGSDATLGYVSDAKAQNSGIELELRKNFAFIDSWLGSNFARNFAVNINYAYILSEVILDESISQSQFGNRPLQGQSPYILNASLQYFNPKTNLSAAFFINRIGRRIAFVREKNGLVPDLWENPRTVLDFSISKLFYKHFEVKFTLSDLLAQDLVFYQDNNNNGKWDEVSTNLNPKSGPIAPYVDPAVPVAQKAAYDNVIFRYKMGMQIGLGIGLKF
ncbi:MAG: TonB-dependent receptor domain-containing protein [Bacteroidota bacterium]